MNGRIDGKRMRREEEKKRREERSEEDIGFDTESNAINYF